MSLIDKLEGVLVGDILLLESSQGYSAAGYVKNCTPNDVELCTEKPSKKNEQFTKRLTIFGEGPTKVFDKSRGYALKHFDSYQVLTPKEE